LTASAEFLVGLDLVKRFPFCYLIKYLRAQVNVINSYVALFPNFAERPPTGEGYNDPLIIDFCNTDHVSNPFSQNPSSRLMPPHIYMFGEAFIIPLGIFTQNDGRPSVGTALSFSIGIR